MRYYDFISQFAGAEHPFGDLAIDIKAEVESNGEPGELLDIYEGDSFAAIYDHLNMRGACKECVNTFVQSWAAYLKHEKKNFRNPVPYVIADQCREINKNLRDIGDELRRHNDFMETITDSMYTPDGEPIAELVDQIVLLFIDCIEYRKDSRGNKNGLFRICGAVDTYEQN